MSTRKDIVTVYWAKPIPVRHFDWECMSVDYDGGDPPGSLYRLVGYGTTEEEAIQEYDDLLHDWQIEHDEDDDDQQQEWMNDYELKQSGWWPR